MNPIIISLGGSVIMQEKPDIEFLISFKELILNLTKKDFQFVIFCGGGKIARDYQDYARQFQDVSQESLDWIGIYATRLNACLLKTMFDKNVDGEIITDPTKKIKFRANIKIASGWKPGWSTDYDAVLVGKQLKAKLVINITNVDYVYDKDPKKNPDAKPIKEITWKGLRKMFPSDWQPGLNSPFDPVASREAEKFGISVYIVGKDITNLKRLISGEKFAGTIIR